ncbi:MAG TPA: site-2 protease family protein [Longimicrobiaceae bacterium]|jgi:hypothetical protein|nr:site-2 protease family protein [Longimicrobiaceae bacterium]
MRHNLTPAWGGVKSAARPLPELFSTLRLVRIHDLEVLQGTLHPGLNAADPAVGASLADWAGPRYDRTSSDGDEVTLVRRAVPRPRERWWLHGLLFALTLLATTFTGALIAGWNPQVREVPLGFTTLDWPVAISAADLAPGLWFSLPLLAILFAHEMGHYLTALRHAMSVSPPYFVPAPYFVNPIGTFGAFIRLRSPMVNRAVLLDVGAGGPLASFVLSIPALAAGLWMSTAHPLPPGHRGAAFYVMYAGQPMGQLQPSLLFQLLAHLTSSAHGAVFLHPLAVAGWFGLFMTAMNLLPAGQLDGGHVTSALFGARQRYVGFAALAIMAAAGTVWSGWWVWAALILVVGRGSVVHPRVFDPEFPLTGARRWVAWACIAIFVLTFVPKPF